MASAPVIPGLVPEVYIPGSIYDAPTPTLIRSHVSDGGGVDFEWHASGTQVYSVTAAGSVVISGWNARGEPVFDAHMFSVECSCPSGQEQLASNEEEGRIFVCKHAESALTSVFDLGAREAIEVLRKTHAEEEATQRKVWEDELPGERERIEHGLTKLSAEKIFELLKKTMKTVDGLRALVCVFPSDIMPPKKELTCGRCTMQYDPQFVSSRSCKIEHPYENTSTEWDESKKSWLFCSRCENLLASTVFTLGVNERLMKLRTRGGIALRELMFPSRNTTQRITLECSLMRTMMRTRILISGDCCRGKSWKHRISLWSTCGA